MITFVESIKNFVVGIFNGLVNFFQTVLSFFNFISTLISDFIESLVYLMRTIAATLTYLMNFINAMPSWLKGITLGMLTIIIAMRIFGRSAES